MSTSTEGSESAVDLAETIQTYVSKRNPKVQVLAVSWTGRNLKVIHDWQYDYQITNVLSRLIFFRPSDGREFSVRNGGFVYLQDGLSHGVPCATFLSEFELAPKSGQADEPATLPVFTEEELARFDASSAWAKNDWHEKWPSIF